MDISYVHPITKEPLVSDENGNLSCDRSGGRYTFPVIDGCYDFATENPDVAHTREVYDEFYGRTEIGNLTIEGIKETWFDKTLAWRKTLLESLGDISGKRILLLGNGECYREFYFLTLGSEVIFSDLSVIAARRAREAFLHSEFSDQYSERIVFHAVDATKLPFPDGSIDIIYGTKFVGFVTDLSQFYSEVARCLKSDGQCRFIDDAYSPAGNAVRRLTVVPLKSKYWKSMSNLSRVRSGGNPYSGFGFKREALETFREKYGFSRMVFIKQFFLLRIVQLVWGKIVKYDLKYIRLARPIYLLIMHIDNLFENTKWMQRNALSLVHGFDK